MSGRTPWIVLCALASWGPIGACCAQPPDKSPQPIVLSYHETPIFLGPHEHTVSAIAFSADGKTLATGTGLLRLWDVATGRLRSVHADDASRGIAGLAFSPDGTRVAVVGGLFGKEAVLWDTASGRIARDFEEPAVAPEQAVFIYKGKPILYRVQTAVAFSPDGKILATAPAGVVLREASSGKVLTTLKEPAKGVKALAFSADGKTLVTAAEDRKVRLWSVPDGALRATLEGPTQPLNSIAISPDGTRIVATSSGSRSLLDRTQVGYVWSWDRPSGPPRKIELGGAVVRQVAFVAPTSVVAAAGRDLFSIDLQGDGTALGRRIWSHTADVLALAVSPDRRLLASGGADRTVDIVELATGKLVHRLPGFMDVFSSLAVSPDGQRFATATIDRRFTNMFPAEDASFAARDKTFFSDPASAGRRQAGEVRVWSSVNGRLQARLPLPACQVTAIKFVPKSDQLVAATWSHDKGPALSVWDAAANKHLRDLTGLASEVLALAVSPDGGTIASGDATGHLDLWETASGRKRQTFKNNQAIEAVAFSTDGKRLAAADADRTVKIRDVATGDVLRTLKSRSYIESIEFSPDGSLLAAGTRDPGLELWDLRTDAPSRTLLAAGDYFDRMPGFVAFSPDGRFVVCGGHGKDIAVFDTASGKLHAELSGHAHPATAVTFLPDGRLVSGGEERSVKMWDAKENQLLATWLVQPADPSQGWDDEWVGFAPSGEFVGSASLKRLVGWQTGGMFVPAPTETQVEALFHRVEAPRN